MSNPVFVDTETTGLDMFYHEAWEFAFIEADGTEHVFNVEPNALNQANDIALKMNRFHERTTAPGFVWHDPEDVAEQIVKIMDGTHIVAANAEFDADFIMSFLSGLDIFEKPWHYHQIDIEDELRGWLAAMGNPQPLPFKSKELVKAAGWGALLPSEDDVHTALHDARWVRDVWNQMYEGTDLEALVAVEG